MENELAGRDEYFAARRSADADLDDSLEAAWDQVEEKEREEKAEDTYLNGEYDQAGMTADDRFEILYDSRVKRAETAQARAVASAGNSPDRPPAKVTKKAAADKAYTDHLGEVWDVMSGVPAKPEATPDAAPPQQADGGLSPEDRAALAQAPPETRAVIDRHLAAHRETYGAVDQLADRWGGALASRGVGTPGDQVQHLDGLLETEHTLATGSPAEKIAVMQRIAQHYGVGAPAPQPQPQAAQTPMLAPPVPQPSRTGNPEHDRLVDQLGRDEHSQQLDAWRQAMATAGPEAQQQQAVHRAQEHVAAIEAETKADGSLARPYFRAVQREMAVGIMLARRSGRQPDLAMIYDQAVASRPDIQEHKLSMAHYGIRDYATQNPVVFDPTIREEMNTIAAGWLRTGRPADMDAILAQALRNKPIIAAKYRGQINQAKAMGRKIEPTIDQQLEAIWQSQAA